LGFLRKLFFLALLAAAIAIVCGALPGLMHLGALSNAQVAGLPRWAIQKRDAWQQQYGVFRKTHTEEQTILHIAGVIRADKTVRAVARVDRRTASLFPASRLSVTLKPTLGVSRPLIVSNPQEMQRAAWRTITDRAHLILPRFSR
jgi:hypothetical protein